MITRAMAEAIREHMSAEKKLDMFEAESKNLVDMNIEYCRKRFVAAFKRKLKHDPQRTS